MKNLKWKRATKRVSVLFIPGGPALRVVHEKTGPGGTRMWVTTRVRMTQNGERHSDRYECRKLENAKKCALRAIGLERDACEETLPYTRRVQTIVKRGNG